MGRLLHAPDGRPRLSVLSIAHLSDAERMFFVTLLLSEVVAWMRAQPGTQTLRALLYMDEVFGYLPPTANPPSKTPLLTLLKQARAYGLGVVLATQNPVDLDYKALGNAGTWLLGRLQTERDRARVVDGLESAAGGGVGDRAPASSGCSAGSRSASSSRAAPTRTSRSCFQTRWTLSYLRGPLTREDVRRLRRPGTPAGAAPAPPSGPAPAAAARPPRRTGARGSRERPPAADPGHRAGLPPGRAPRPRATGPPSSPRRSSTTPRRARASTAGSG